MAFSVKYFQPTYSTLFAIDTGGDRLLRVGTSFNSASQPGGAVTSLGTLGVDLVGEVGFESKTVGEGWVAATSAGAPTQSRLYAVSFANGAMTLVGVIGAGSGLGPVTALTATVPSGVRLSSSVYAGEEGSPVIVTVERVGSRQGAIAARIYTTGNASATPGVDYATQDQTVGFASGDGAPKTLAVPLLADALIELPRRSACS